MHTDLLLSAFHLEPSGVPIYVQIREQLLGAIGAGLLRPGEQMPTMRQLAVALAVDLNTVRHAYDELERMGVLRLERGRGSFVAEPPAPAQGLSRMEAADRIARQALAKAAAAGVEPHFLIERMAALAAAKED
jgi:GntR family transcriptional regulator